MAKINRHFTVLLGQWAVYFQKILGRKVWQREGTHPHCKELLSSSLLTPPYPKASLKFQEVLPFFLV